MTQIVIGIDPGMSGGIAAIHVSDTYEVVAMPIRRNPDFKTVRRNQVDAWELWQMFARLCGSHSPEDVLVVIEKQQAMGPNDKIAKSSLVNLGHSTGCFDMLFAARRLVEVSRPTPQRWKKHYGLGPSKKDALALARKLWPNAPIQLEKHDGLAEALLIARWGWAFCT
jgi:hypothetical protein